MGSSENDTALQLFEQLPLDQDVHSTRSLKEHLFGVYTILTRWNVSRSVAIAGLFHSLYGTSSYIPANLGEVERAAITEAIGHEAEGLVDIYCRAERSKLLTVAAIATTELRVLPSKDLLEEAITVSPDQFRSLLDMLYADRVEQLSHRAIVPVTDWSRLHLSYESLILWRSASRYLCPAAQSHLASSDFRNRL
jgi:hypothetical protein